jgi:hypothetical protein
MYNQRCCVAVNVFFFYIDFTCTFLPSVHAVDVAVPVQWTSSRWTIQWCYLSCSLNESVGNWVTVCLSPFKDAAYLFHIRTQCVPRCKHSPLRL